MCKHHIHINFLIEKYTYTHTNTHTHTCTRKDTNADKQTHTYSCMMEIDVAQLRAAVAIIYMSTHSVQIY